MTIPAERMTIPAFGQIQERMTIPAERMTVSAFTEI